MPLELPLPDPSEVWDALTLLFLLSFLGTSLSATSCLSPCSLLRQCSRRPFSFSSSLHHRLRPRPTAPIPMLWGPHPLSQLCPVRLLCLFLLVSRPALTFPSLCPFLIIPLLPVFLSSKTQGPARHLHRVLTQVSQIHHP